MRIVDVEQGSYEWLEKKRGVINGTIEKQAHQADQKGLIYELIEEVEEGVDEEESYLSPAMQWGREQEPIAKLEYESRKGVKLLNAGLLLNDDHDWIGISPDGYSIDENGILGLETKCPDGKKHVMMINEKKIGSSRDYWENQVFHWFQIDPNVYAVDFVSYDSRFTPNPMYIQRVWRKEHLVRIEKERQSLMKLRKLWLEIDNNVRF